MVDPTTPTPEAGLEQPVDVFQREAAISRELTEDEASQIIRRLGGLSLDEETYLYEYQVEAFDDIVASFAAGTMENYTLQPTGAGKTVEFVTLSKLFIDASRAEDRQARVLVLEPNIDLTIQTVGSVDEETGKKRGFIGFAPELDVRPTHSKMGANQRTENMREADVLVTTYNTFRNMVDSLVELDTMDRDQLLDEIEGHKADAAQAATEKDAAVAERAEFIKNAYLRQEVRRVSEVVDNVLFGAGQDVVLNSDQSDALRKILAITRTSDPDDIKLKDINQQMKRLVNDRVKQHVAWIEYAVEARKRRINARLSEFRKNTVDFELEKELIIANEPSDDEIQNEGAQKFQLDKLERFVAGYSYRHRFGTYPAASKLIHREDHEALNELNDKVNDKRAAKRLHNAKIREKQSLIVLQDSMSQYDLMICDEVHRVMGSETWEAIREYAHRKGIAIAGFTATDEFYDRKLKEYITHKAHELTRQEAIKRSITNPIAMFVHETGLRFDNVFLDSSGDYDAASLRSMRFSEERNLTGVNYMKLLSEAGYHGIASAIPGEEGAHAKVISELANNTEIMDPKSGESRNLKAVYVLGNTPIDQRQEYYAQLERGEIDWIVFVDAIREGWDSDNAKSLVNFRPTRSPLLAIQRVGRIGRKYENAPISVVVDLFDGIESEEFHNEIPPVLGVDIYDLDDVDQGFVVGEHPDKNNPLFSSLAKMLPYKMKAYHSRFVQSLESMTEIDAQGFALAKSGIANAKEWQDYKALLRSFRGYLPKEILMDAIDSENPQIRAIKGRRGIGVVPLFNIRDVEALHRDAPEINPSKLYVDPSDGQNWITAEGCTTLLSKRFPSLSADEVSDTLRTIETQTETKFAKKVARVPIFYTAQMEVKTGFDLMYKMDEIIDRLVPYLMEK